ncbi:MAG: S8 family serine peptidase, partial [Pirellulaceae bacterium]|nr:S8 family serine peptidase [Pirellulaceae bacterium]
MKIWDTFRRWSGVGRPKRAARIKNAWPGRRDVLGSLRSRSLRVETFEQRVLLSITSPPGFDDLEQIVCPMTDYNYLSDSLSRAVYRASDLSGYDQELLASTYQWVVGVNEAKADTCAPQLAASLNADFLQYAPVLSNATVWEFPETMSWVTVANTLESAQGVDYYYPLVAEKLVPMAVPNDPLFGEQWHLQNTGQTGGTPGVDANVISAWDSVTGAGVIIAIVDDSLQMDHPDLVSSIRADLSYDYRDGDNDPSPGIDLFGEPDNHGTAVAGVAGAVGNNSLGVSGSAPAAQLAGVRLIGGFTTDVEISSSLLHQLEQIDIYNNSWGPTRYLQTQGPLTLAAIETGVATGRDGLGSIYVFAAGNSRTEAANTNHMALASLRQTIAVAAIGAHGTYADYSNPGASLLVSGHSSWGYDSQNDAVDGIVTTDRTGEDGYNETGTGELPRDFLPDIDYTSTFGGTSSATPLVSGVIALMLEANPGLTYRDVQHILVETASLNDPDNLDWTQNAAGYHVNHNYGFGAIDAAAAVDLAFEWENVSEEITTGSGIVMVNTAIPDGGSTGVRSSVTLGDSVEKVEWAEVTVDIDHSSPADLEIVLISPDGTRSVLAESSSVASWYIYGDYNYWTLTSARHWGEASEGEWTLEVRDLLGGDSGTLRSWELNVFGTTDEEPGPGPGPVTMVGPELVALVPNQGGTIVNNDALDIAPRELTLKFNEEQVIDSTTLGAIRLVRAGGDAKIGNANDVVVNYGWIGIGERPNEVIVRFAETLPDDMYMITIVGAGDEGDLVLKNVDGGIFHQGEDLSITFSLNLGAQIVSIVPQPTYRDDAGNLQQHRDQIEIYFNDDTLDAASAQNPNYYRLSLTGETATTQDDV